MRERSKRFPSGFRGLPNGVVYGSRLIILAMLSLMALVSSASAFTLYFDQNAYPGTVWLQLMDPFYNSVDNYFQGTYGSGQSFNFKVNNVSVLMSEPVKLSDIGSGGVTITHAQSTHLFVYYDDPKDASRTAAPSQDTSKLRFQDFELTMMGVHGDQGNITAINYFTAPLGIKSYRNDPHTYPDEPFLQQVGFGSHTAAEIGATFASVTKGNAAAYKMNDQNKIVRYLGPSNVFSSGNPWPSFIPYAKSINAAGQSTHIYCNNAFNFRAPEDTPVYTFGADMTATVADDGTITASGKLTVSTNTAIKPGNPSIPDGGGWDGATITISPTHPSSEALYNAAIYGQVATGAVTFGGTAWGQLKTFIDTTLMTPQSAHSVPCPNPGDAKVCANPSLGDLNAYDTTKNKIIGDITTGMLGGFFNSAYIPAGKSTPIKDMKSDDWWHLNPVVAFRTIQPLHQYYNIYGDVIFSMSGNTVYGIPYSDRFSNGTAQGPLVETVWYNGGSVGYWVVSIGAPLSAPTPGHPPLELLLDK
ncbi:MAG: hypothetical protein AAGU21_05135 [Solidesulfovibrio sp.]|uniref:hypothetical protein n=1 Tax=Solidesulfovibrio sp. TaxID=2910990 RepID=UPI002B1FAEE3|nr:hypothetical protein [Solidesulfovibrio sp.]MEA4856003.1 hypothetical protein [Solidesulfovibrio sp.]